VASQNGATAPVVSITAVDEYPNTVPLVPRLTTSSPSDTHPAPKALIMLSPLPTLTSAPGGTSPASHPRDASAVTTPIVPSGGTRSGNVDLNRGSTKLQRFSSNSRVFTSMTPMPDASPRSIASTPVSL